MELTGNKLRKTLAETRRAQALDALYYAFFLVRWKINSEWYSHEESFIRAIIESKTKKPEKLDKKYLFSWLSKLGYTDVIREWPKMFPKGGRNDY